MGYLRKRGHSWYARYRDTDGKWKQRNTRQPTKALAQRYLTEAEARVARGDMGIPEFSPTDRLRKTITVRELSSRFLGCVAEVAGYASPRIKNLGAYRNAQRTVHSVRLLPRIGNRVAASITRADVEHLRDALTAEGFAGNTVTNTIASLGKLFAWAIRDGHLTGPNPVLGIEKPRGESSIDYFSAAEVGGILSAACERSAAANASSDARATYPAVALAVYAGLRKGEIFGLRWIDIRFDEQRLDVMRSYRLAPKGGKPRHLPLHLDLALVLRAWRQLCPIGDDGLVIPLRSDGKRGRLHMGEPQDMLELPSVLAAAACRRPAKPWHSLRHTFAANFMMAGGNILTLQKLLGHADVTTTMIYAHLARDFMAGEVARLNFAQPCAPDVTDLAEERRRRALADDRVPLGAGLERHPELAGATLDLL